MKTGNETRCLVCGSKVLMELQNVRDTRFGIEKIWNICRCVKCKIEQTIPAPKPEELERLYEIYYNFGGEKRTTYTLLRKRFLSSNLYHFWLIIDGDISFHQIRSSGRLLDIGCNEGRGLKIYKYNGFEVEGLELNERAAQEARKKGFKVYVDPIEEFWPKIFYDVVILSNVLEHSLQSRNMLKHAARILKIGGQVWISCPNNCSWLRYLFGKYWINWHVPFHIVHFSQKTLEQMLHQAGFEVTSSKQITPALWVAHSFIARLFAKPGIPTRQLRNPFLVAFLMLLIRGLLFPVLWLENRLGRGDCLVVVARKVLDSCVS